MRFCVAILAVLALLTGCGGDDGSSNKDGRASGSGYSVALPSGWSDVTDRPEVAESPIRIDRLGRIYTVTFTAPPGTFQAEQKDFEQILGSWQWE